MNAKGSRNERRTMHLLEAAGYGCTRASASVWTSWREITVETGVCKGTAQRALSGLHKNIRILRIASKKNSSRPL